MKTVLHDLLPRLKGCKVLVIGDLMLDEYVWGTVTRLSPEAPVPIVQADRVSYMPGGSANVAMNVAGLGGEVSLIAVVGQDETGIRLRALIGESGISIDGLVTETAQTTPLKTRIVAHSQHVVRVDRERSEAVSSSTLANVDDLVAAKLPWADVMVVSDYAKGLLQPELLNSIFRRAQALSMTVIVDPKGRDFSKYRGASVVTPNQSEAAVASNTDPNAACFLEEAARLLFAQLDTKALLITRGEAGMSLFEKSGKRADFSATAREVYDVTGAGDTVVATFALALAAGATRAEAASLANYAAGSVVAKVGTIPIDIDQLGAMLE